MNRNLLFTLLLIALLAMASQVFGFDNEITHPLISESAIKFSQMDKKLIKMGFSDGMYTSLTYDGSSIDTDLGSVTPSYTNKIIDIVKKGSYAEDVPNCRASNHFHNPLKPWDSSQMTDQPVWLDASCITWKPFVSNVTWATGYLARSPEGAKADLQLRYNAPVNWNTARVLYYQALTASTQEDREKGVAI